MTIYNSIGKVYSNSRLPDLRIVNSLIDLLNLPKKSIIADIGAGTGGYSRAIAEREYSVYAVEPSSIMRSQFVEHAQVKYFTGYAENIPLANASVDGVICILAMHHFSDLSKAVREMHRITKKGALVFLTFDPRLCEKLWLVDYFPLYRDYDFRVFPPINDVVELIQSHTQRTVEIYTLKLPHDLTDMFAASGWRRPEIYLNPEVRANISALALADADEVEEGVIRLQEDLETGKWNAKYGEIRNLSEIDVGYRFLCARR